MGAQRVYYRDVRSLPGGVMSWRIWAKALGEKSGKTDKESDKIAVLRTAFVILTVITDIILNFWMTHI